MSESTPWDGPEADVAEQRAEVGASPDTSEQPGSRARWDVDPADAAEQEIEVPIDEDEWR